MFPCFRENICVTTRQLVREQGAIFIAIKVFLPSKINNVLACPSITYTTVNALGIKFYFLVWSNFFITELVHFAAHPAALSDAGELLLDVLRGAPFAPGAGNSKYSD